LSVLVTRPEPDNLTTAELLTQRGFAALLAPVLQFEALPIRHDESVRYAGAIATSANALRAIRSHPLSGQLIQLPLYAVGARTADAACKIGFSNVRSADGDVAALRKLITDAIPKRERKVPLLYLCGSDISGDIVTGLASDGIATTPLTVYRMIPVGALPDTVCAAFAAGSIEAVLHYSPRSAAAFVAAIRGAGLEVAGLAVLQVCISEAVARVLREAGAARLVVAEKPDETAMMGALERTLPPPQNRRG
jgi:uroporphyrinogen-III synthase